MALPERYPPLVSDDGTWSLECDSWEDIGIRLKLLDLRPRDPVAWYVVARQATEGHVQAALQVVPIGDVLVREFVAKVSATWTRS